jgi:hypothetical protein
VEREDGRENAVNATVDVDTAPAACLVIAVGAYSSASDPDFREVRGQPFESPMKTQTLEKMLYVCSLGGEDSVRMILDCVLELCAEGD